MKKIFFKLNSKQKQSGIALIFALAMLSLLLIMAIGFATSSIFEQKAAYNSANTTSARLLSQSVVSRVLALVQTQISLYGQTLDYSYDNWTVNKGDTDMLDHLTTNIANAPIYTYNTSHPVTWEYIKTNDGTTDRLIGRFAYVVIPIGGIDPAATVSSGIREELGTERRIGASVDEVNIMAVSPNDIVASASPGADQVSAGKFNFAATSGSTPAGKLPAAGYWTSLSNMFSVMGITSGPLKSKFLKWFVAGSSATALAQSEYFWVDRNGNGLMDSVSGTNDEFFHRFNIFNRTTVTWNSFTATDSVAVINLNLLCDSSNNGVPDSLPNPYPPPPAVPASDDGIGIPWLAFFGYDKNGVIDETGPLKGTFPNITARRHQIAANLIDYCDTDTNNPTYDTKNFPRSTWLNSGVAYDPLYTGNELTPYINEVGFNIHIAAVRTTKTTVTVTFTPEIEFEAINIYPVADIPVWMAVRYSFNYNIIVNGVTTPYSAASTASAFTSLVWPAASLARYAKTNFNGTAITQTLTVTSGSAPVISVTGCTLTVDKAVLSTSSTGAGNVDCSLIKKSSSAWNMISNWTTSTVAATAPPTEFSIAFQTNDPRQNLNPGDWSTTETPFAAIAPTTGTAPYSTVGTLGAKNIFNGVAVDPSAPSPDKDPEVVTDPAYNPGAAAGFKSLSTAYIRNGAMLSPWELGFIHRGVAWQTLNLKEYDPNKANKFVAANVPSTAYPYARIPGGGAYSDPVNGGGDANILNQVKIISVTGNKTANNKININSTYVDSSTGQNIALQALLANIRIGNNPANLGIAAGDAEGSKIVPSVGMYNVINSIMTRTSGMDYITRAEVANAMYCTGPGSYKRALSGGVCGIVQDTDAKQEELIGKFINLTDVGGKNNYFYVIVVAQAIKDIGGPSGGAGINITKSKMNGSTRINSQVSCKLGTFDYDNTNNFYFDEISGEQKVRLLVFSDPSDSFKCKILSYEFIE